jgi:hypothetical protein
MQDLTDAELHALACEIREWHKTGVTGGQHLSKLSSILVRDAALSEDGITQTAEALVLQEVCSRWISEHHR